MKELTKENNLEGKVFYRLAKVMFWFSALLMGSISFSEMNSWSSTDVGYWTGYAMGQIMVAFLVYRTVLYIAYGKRNSKGIKRFFFKLFRFFA